jgi:hypothetical protein
MTKTELANLAALAIATGTTIKKIETGARAYDPAEFYQDRKPVSKDEKLTEEANSAYYAYEKAQQEAFVRRFG